MLLSGSSWRECSQAKLPYVTMLTKIWDAWMIFSSSSVERRAMLPGMAVGSLLSGVSHSTCDPHVHFTATDKPKSSGIKLLYGVHSCIEGVERSANQQEVENNCS